MYIMWCVKYHHVQSKFSPYISPWDSRRNFHIFRAYFLLLLHRPIFRRALASLPPIREFLAYDLDVPEPRCHPRFSLEIICYPRVGVLLTCPYLDCRNYCSLEESFLFLPSWVRTLCFYVASRLFFPIQHFPGLWSSNPPVYPPLTM